MILDPNNDNVDNSPAVVVESNLRICHPPSTWKYVCFDQDPAHIINFKGIYSNIFKIVNAYLISQPNSPSFRRRVIRCRRNFSDVWRGSS